MEYCFLIFVILLSMTASMVSGLTLELYHKSHPNISQNWSPTSFNAPYRAKVSFRQEYVIHFSIGTPPFKTFAVFDTASAVFWLQTSTCDRCMPQPPETLYDVTRSSTFEAAICTSLECGAMIGFNGGCEVRTVKCTYMLNYFDGTNSSGYVGTDIVTFMNGSAPEGRKVPPLQVRMLMGVGTHNYGMFYKGNEVMAAPGVFGVSFSGRFQLTHNFETGQFSYCIPIDKNKVGYVKFGDAAEILGTSVNLVEDPNYKLDLTGVSLNDEPMKAPKESWDWYTMIIDSGTPISRMHTDFLDALRDELEGMFGEGISFEDYGMCWNDITAEDEQVKKMTITLHFGELDVTLSQPHIWEQVDVYRGDYLEDRLYCINFMENERGYKKESVLGTVQTTNKNIAFNVLLRKAAIQDRIC